MSPNVFKRTLLLGLAFILVMIAAALLLARFSPKAAPAITESPAPIPKTPTLAPTATPSLTIAIATTDHWPTPVPPNLTEAVQIMNIPPCCDDSSATAPVLSETQIAYYTQNAPPALTLTNAPTRTSEFLPPIYRTPSAELTSYTDPKSGIMFQYPANYALSNTSGTEIHLVNHLQEPYRLYSQFDPDDNLIAIKVVHNKPSNQTLADFIADHLPDPTVWDVIEQTQVKTAQGYTGIKRVDQLKTLDHPKLMYVFLECKDSVCLIFAQQSKYDSVFDQVLNSLVLP